jgi:hypothetical protein
VTERSVVAAFEALYDTVRVQRDAARALELFAPDDDIWFGGSDVSERAEGPSQLRALLDFVARSPRSFRFTWDTHKVRIEGGVAWVLGEGRLAVDGADAGLYRALAILVERDGSWLWHTHHGSLPRPA